MAVAKVAVTIDPALLQEVDRAVSDGEYPNRSRLINEALLSWCEQRSRRHRLLRELARLDPDEEQAMAEERLIGEVAWPPF